MIDKLAQDNKKNKDLVKRANKASKNVMQKLGERVSKQVEGLVVKQQRTEEQLKQVSKGGARAENKVKEVTAILKKKVAADLKDMALNLATFSEE